MKKEDLFKEWKSEFSAWMFTFGSAPIELVVSEDWSESYEMTRRTIFKLENGQYALVKENGCSCYTYADADIELFPSKRAALVAFKKPSYEGDRIKWGNKKINEVL